MSVADAISAMAAYLGEALHHPVDLGGEAAGGGDARPQLRIRLQAMEIMAERRQMSLQDAALPGMAPGWTAMLLLLGDADGLLAQARLLEQAGTAILASPLLSGPGWRAEMLLDPAPEAGALPALAVRLRVLSA